MALVDCEMVGASRNQEKVGGESKVPYVLRRDVLEVLSQQNLLNPRLEEDESSEGRQGHQYQRFTSNGWNLYAKYL